MWRENVRTLHARALFRSLNVKTLHARATLGENPKKNVPSKLHQNQHVTHNILNFCICRYKSHGLITYACRPRVASGNPKHILAGILQAKGRTGASAGRSQSLDPPAPLAEIVDGYRVIKMIACALTDLEWTASVRNKNAWRCALPGRIRTVPKSQSNTSLYAHAACKKTRKFVG